jgi:uncharacterized protein (UPF0254 family)
MSPPLPPYLQTSPVARADLQHRKLASTYMKGIREKRGMNVSAAGAAAVARGAILEITG